MGGADPDHHTHLGTIVVLDDCRLSVDVAVGHPTEAPVAITAETRFAAWGSTVHCYPGEHPPAVFHMDATSAETQRQRIMDPFQPVTLQTIDGEIRTSHQPGLPVGEAIEGLGSAFGVNVLAAGG